MWQAVPNDAIAVVELTKVDEWWYEHEEIVSLKRVINTQLMKSLKRLIKESDTILKAKGYSVFDITGDKTIALIFTKGEEEIASTLVIPESSTDAKFLEVLMIGFDASYGKTNIKTHQTPTGQVYTEIGKEAKFFYVARVEGLLCVSTSKGSMLSVLNAVQTATSSSEFLKKKDLHNATEVNTENLNVYLNPIALFQAIKPLMKDESKSFLSALEHFADNAFLDIKFDDEAVYFNGFTHDSDTTFTFANCFKSQQPIPFSLKSMIPNRTLSFAYLGISDGMMFKHNLEEYSWSSEKPLQDGWSVLKNTYQINVDEVYEGIRGEVVLIEVLNRFKAIDKLVYLKPANIQTAQEQYLNMAKGILEQSEELKIETFQDVDIVQMGDLDFPGKVFGNYFKGFTTTYFAVIGDYMVFGESPQSIKSLINDIESEEVWSRSLEKNFLVERYFTDANFGYYVDLKQAIDWLDSNLSEKGKKSLGGVKDLFSQVGMFSIQITNENEKLFTNVISVFEGQMLASVDAPIEAEATLEKSAVLSELFFESPLASKPFVVKNHVDRSLEVLVVDSTNKLHLVSSKGTLLWSYQLSGPLVSSIHQIDVYKNQKLQYLLATAEQVYCLDRLGKAVEGYPYSMKQGSKVIQHLSVIDYDGSKDYRIGVASNDGFLELHNIFGKVLDGWNPIKFDSPITQALKHSRVRGKDFMLAADQHKIYAFSRRGEVYAGFPVAFEGTITGDWFVSEGPSFRKSAISIILDGVKNVDVSYNGKVAHEDDFRSISATPNVKIVASAGNEEKVYLTNPVLNEWTVFNADRKQLFTMSLAGYTDLKLQYYPVLDKELFVLVSEAKNQVMIYNKKGHLVGSEVLDGGQEIALLYSSSSNSYKVYITNRKSLRVLDIKAEK